MKDWCSAWPMTSPFNFSVQGNWEHRICISRMMFCSSELYESGVGKDYWKSPVSQVLEEECERPDCFCSDAEALLADDGGETKVHDSIFGYPSTPLYRCVARMLNEWMETQWVDLIFTGLCSWIVSVWISFLCNLRIIICILFNYNQFFVLV